VVSDSRILNSVSNLRADVGMTVLAIDELLVSMPNLGCTGVKLGIFDLTCIPVRLHCYESRASGWLAAVSDMRNGE